MVRSIDTSFIRIAFLIAAAILHGDAIDLARGETPPPEGPPAAAPQTPPVAATDKVDKPEKKPDFPPFEEVSEGHEKIAGFFDLYYDAKRDHLLGVIPKKLIDKDFLISTSISGGPAFAGFMWDGRLVRWREMDKMLVLIEPDLQYDPADSSTVKDVVARTYTDRIVLSTKIVARRDGDPAIDLDDVFKADRAGLGEVYGAPIATKLSTWARRKGFEKNVELSVNAAFMKPGEEGIRAQVHYSLSELPANDYKPRAADDRVGYFMSAVKNYGRDHNDKTIFDRSIHRWNLRKTDSKAAVSDVHPDDQIVFFMEKSIPVQYRRYVREGVLEWNKAYEKIGILNAVAVRQQSDTNEWKDVDPEDVRYNFIRWIVSGTPFAMGPSRVNPRTGQILDADILIDDSFVRVLLAQYARMAARGPATSYDPQLTEFLTNHPEWAFVPQEERLTPTTAHYGGVDMLKNTELVRRFMGKSHAQCTYAHGLTHEMVFADFILRAEGCAGLSEEYIGQFLKWVVAHEVGHTLGLRHNFKASSWKSLDEILSATGIEDAPTSASVMDYCPAMFAKDRESQKNFYTVGLGPYDFWAIEYGYRHTDDQLKTEEELLKSVAARSGEPGHAYGSDEDRGFFAPDPFVNVYDNGNDPVAYAKYRFDLIRNLEKDIDKWAIADGESYSRLRRVFDTLLFEYGRVTQFAARAIGGQGVNRNHKGDAGERPSFEIIPAKQQREALKFLVDNVFSKSAFNYDPELINKLGAGRWGHWDSDDYDGSIAYPLHDRIAATQFWALFHLLNPFTITRIYDAELKVPKNQDALTVPELMNDTTTVIWSELDEKPAAAQWNNRNPMITSLRRSLQRSHLQFMLDILLTEPGIMMPADAHSVARHTLKSLSQRIGDFVTANAAGTMDAFTRAHLDEARARIDKALDADFKL